jgi:hypothetical protein
MHSRAHLAKLGPLSPPKRKISRHRLTIDWLHHNHGCLNSYSSTSSGIGRPPRGSQTTSGCMRLARGCCMWATLPSFFCFLHMKLFLFQLRGACFSRSEFRSYLLIKFICSNKVHPFLDLLVRTCKSFARQCKSPHRLFGGKVPVA